MKIRNGFVSNSSSCSYVVDFGTKITSPEDLEKVLNKNFWKHSDSTDSWKRGDEIYTGLKEKFPFKRICELIFRLMQEPSDDNGERILEMLLEDEPEDLPSFPKFRADFLRTKYGKKFYKKQLESEYIDDRFEAEKEIWERYENTYEDILKAEGIKEIKEHPENIAFFSFGNESEFFNKGKDRFSREEVHLITVLRNYGLAPILFRGLRWEAKDYS